MPPDNDDDGQERPGFHPGGTPNTRAFDLLHSTSHHLLSGKFKAAGAGLASGAVGELVGEAIGGPVGAVVGNIAAELTHKAATAILGKDEDEDEED